MMKNSFLEWEKYFKELKDKELRKWETKIRKEIKELFFKSTEFEEEKIEKKIPSAKSTFSVWYDWIINYILEPMKNGGWC